ncbi:FecR family protein [Steroidobacter sp.]|uniref:FecR family protein n=1 Tax=Steroidobacter sp. TaxID=1978227 RepID=UPI001A5F7E4D|nr:FecR domain-containing protein [Steroidobacter sp.]MBL8268364.1 FecR domain-containing protein [Steroidobacter sp.]
MSIESTERAEQEAAAWLMRREGVDWSETDKAHLEQWQDASLENAVAFIRLEQGWEKARRLHALAGGVEKGTVPPPGQWQISPFFEAELSLAAERRAQPPVGVAEVAGNANRSNRARWGALAATVLVALGTTAYLVVDHYAADRYSTSLGVVTSVPMSDGSRVTLNTASEIRLALTDTERKVELAKGEAFFEVAKDASRPFVVDAGSKRIVAVGTAFSVRRERDEVAVVVTEGVVRLESVEPSGAGEVASVATRLESLNAGKVAHATADGVLIENKEALELQEQLAWRTGYLVFNETPLANAVAEFNRYSAQKIVIDDPAVAGYRVSGKFRSTSLDAFVRLLGNAFPIEVQRERERILLTKRD